MTIAFQSSRFTAASAFMRTSRGRIERVKVELDWIFAASDAVAVFESLRPSILPSAAKPRRADFPCGKQTGFRAPARIFHSRRDDPKGKHICRDPATHGCSHPQPRRPDPLNRLLLI